MAEQTEQQDQTQAQETNGGANGGHKNAVRAAAIAAATGAAAIAARKAFSGREQSGEGTERSSSRRRSGGGGNDSTLTAMATSGLSAAKDSLLPFAEDAAGAAGEWVGRNGPDYLTDTIVPQFIKGFERGSKPQQQSE